MTVVTGMPGGASITKDGLVSLAFRKVLVGRTRTKHVTLRNDGVLPCTVFVDAGRDKDFSLANHSHSFTLDPRMTETLAVNCHPNVVGSKSFPIRFRVADNPFAESLVTCTANANVQEVSLEGVSTGPEDDVTGTSNLRLGAIAVGLVCDSTFTLCNNTHNPIAFQWIPPNVATTGVQFTPTVGHVLGKSAKTIRVRVTPNQAGNISAMASAKLSKIKYTDVWGACFYPPWTARYIQDHIKIYHKQVSPKP